METEYAVKVLYGDNTTAIAAAGFDTWKQADAWIEQHEWDYPGDCSFCVISYPVKESIPDCDYSGLYRT